MATKQETAKTSFADIPVVMAETDINLPLMGVKIKHFGLKNPTAYVGDMPNQRYERIAGRGAKGWGYGPETPMAIVCEETEAGVITPVLGLVERGPEMVQVVNLLPENTQDTMWAYHPTVKEGHWSDSEWRPLNNDHKPGIQFIVYPDEKPIVRLTKAQGYAKIDSGEDFFVIAQEN